MRVRPALAGLLAALALGGCAADESGVEGPVTVYVSLPLTGPRAPDGRDAADGARLALAQAGGKAGGLEVRAVYADDAEGKVWDPAAVGRNARSAAQDSSAAAYLGELDSEPTRGSVPITNDAGIVQVSPGASAIDLTGPAEGYPDSPERYRPSGSATFARVVPSDSVQVRALAEWTEELGIRGLAASSDDSPYGRLMESAFAEDAVELGVQVDEAVAGAPAPGGPAFLAGRDPDGPGVLDDGRTEHLVSGALAPSRLPKSGFAADFEKRFGREPGPYAAYGFEAMRVILDGIAAADGADDFRPSVVDGVLDSQHPDSILGLYSITDEGDSTLCAVQRYERPRGGGAETPGESVCPD